MNKELLEDIGNIQLIYNDNGFIDTKLLSQSIFKLVEREKLKARIDQTEKFYKEIRKTDDRSAGVLFIGKILLQQKLKELR